MKTYKNNRWREKIYPAFDKASKNHLVPITQILSVSESSLNETKMMTVIFFFKPEEVE